MRIMRYLFQHKAALALVFSLLIVQVFCDLSLPNFTSQIVDVGIQQGGISDVSPERLSQATYEDLGTLLEGDQEALLHASYDKQTDASSSQVASEEDLGSGKEAQNSQVETSAQTGQESQTIIYVLNDYGRENRSALNDAMLRGLIVVDTLRSGGYSSLSQKGAENAALESLRSLESTGSALLEQQGIQSSRAEYQRAGVDLGALQMNYLLETGALMLGVAALSLLVSIVVGFVAARTGTKIGRRLREQLFERVVSFSDKEIDSFSAASLITRGTNDVQLIQMVTIILQRMVLYAPIMAIGGIIMVVQSTLSLWWIIVLAVVVVLAVIGLLMGVTMPKFRIVQKLIDEVNLVAREQLTGMSAVRAFNREAYEEARFERANHELFKTQLFTNRAMSFMMPTMMLVMNLASVMIIWFGAQFVDMGTMQTGDLIALITYSMMIVMSFLMIGMVAIMLPRANVAAERIDEVIATECSIIDPAQSKAASTTELGARVSFEDVSFAYSADDACVLEHVSFTAEPGETCAIIGSTGSGKSTVIKLIERFRDVSSGAVRIDGVDVRDIPQHELREMLAYVPQKAFLFSGTIQSNLEFAGDVSAERRDLALDISQSREFVEGKEGGIASEISQGGTNVSGGQRQRLAIARALARDAKAYLFDDSFSALDYKTDSKLRLEIAEKLSGRTVVIVAQRISTIMNADKIIVLDEGKLVGQGTHVELLQSCKVYREIALSQLSAEELAAALPNADASSVDLARSGDDAPSGASGSPDASASFEASADGSSPLADDGLAKGGELHG